MFQSEVVKLSHVEALVRHRSPLALSLPRPLPHQRLILPDTMQQYYRARAMEYDLFYQVPERRDELSLLQAWLTERARGRTILEVAAGTGYWTEIAARSAQAITATDLNAETLEIAATRRLGPHVILRTADAYSLPHSTMAFDVGMAHLWWSHVERQKRKSFLSHFASRLRPAATLLMIDQLYVEGLTSPISREDQWGNQYTIRKLKDGSTYEIIKNFPQLGEPEETFEETCTNVSVLRLQHFWALSAQVRD
jgi:demethylmenaquinone methyltransferase/2-methoxy-6-polyprenyl-1,4-benzoquinol methylase